MKRFLLGLAVSALLSSSALAAVTANSPVTPQTPNRGVVQFLGGTDSAGTYKTLYTAGTNGSKCYGMWATSNDATATHLLTVQIVNTSVKYGGMSVTIPTTASSTTLPGFSTGVAPFALTSAALWAGLPVDSDGNPYIALVTGDTIQATFTTTITSADVINVYVSCSDF